ncbi:MAG: rRNA maturation RNase YbeY [Kiloniellaceae bacterium]
MSDDSDSSSTDPNAITIAVTVRAPAWRERLPEAERLVRQAALAALVGAADEAAPPQRAEVSLLLADDATVRRLNRDYRGRDKSTNVLSFPAAETFEAPGAGPVLLGDVVLAYETVRREAEEQDKSLAAHVSHLVVHGVLHLLGYDHEVEQEAELMERREAAILDGLGLADPYGRDASAGVQR